MLWRFISLALLATSFAFAGPTTQVSTDERFALTLPDGWRPSNDPDHRYQIDVENATLRLFVALGSDAKEDLVDQRLEQFEENRTNWFSTAFTDVELGEPTPTTVNGRRAIQRTIRGVQGNGRWVYVCTAIETEKSFVYIMCCTTPSRLNGARETFDLIIASFRELDGRQMDKPGRSATQPEPRK